MKKILSLILAGMMILSLAACNSSEPQTVTLNIEESGILSEYTLEANGDVVHTIRQTTTMDCTGFTEEQFAIIDEAIQEYKALYAEIEGVVYDVAVNETAMVETVSIDVSNEETVAALSEAGLMPVEGEGAISLEKTVESMVELGWTVKE